MGFEQGGLCPETRSTLWAGVSSEAGSGLTAGRPHEPASKKTLACARPGVGSSPGKGPALKTPSVRAVTAGTWTVELATEEGKPALLLWLVNTRLFPGTPGTGRHSHLEVAFSPSCRGFQSLLPSPPSPRSPWEGRLVTSSQPFAGSWNARDLGSRAAKNLPVIGPCPCGSGRASDPWFSS